MSTTLISRSPGTSRQPLAEGLASIPIAMAIPRAAALVLRRFRALPVPSTLISPTNLLLEVGPRSRLAYVIAPSMLYSTNVFRRSLKSLKSLKALSTGSQRMNLTTTPTTPTTNTPRSKATQKIHRLSRIRPSVPAKVVLTGN
jgi:hypothetical protein